MRESETDTQAVRVERPDQQELARMGVFDWPVWSKEPSTFDWHYDQQETCYLLEGTVVVEPADGDPVSFGSGDLVTFPQGMDCVWKISQGVRKHYRFG